MANCINNELNFLISNKSKNYSLISKDLEITLIKENEFVGDWEVVYNKPRKFTLKCVSSHGILFSFTKKVLICSLNNFYSYFLKNFIQILMSIIFIKNSKCSTE